MSVSSYLSPVPRWTRGGQAAVPLCLGLLFAALLARYCWSASLQPSGMSTTTAVVKAEVLPAVSVSGNTTFRFQDSQPGAPPEQIEPTPESNSPNLKLSAKSNVVYAIQMPKTVTLVHRSRNGTSDSIEVGQFTTTLTAWSGTTSPRFGATRQSIPANAQRGVYVGRLPMTVVFQ